MIDLAGAAERVRWAATVPERRTALDELETRAELQDDLDSLRERTRQEVAHFRWLALRQCACLNAREIAEHEQAWSSRTLHLVAGVLADTSVSLPKRRIAALRVILDRGEPYLQGTDYDQDGFWPEIIGASEERANGLATELSTMLVGVAPNSVRTATNRTAGRIGLEPRQPTSGLRKR